MFQKLSFILMVVLLSACAKTFEDRSQQYLQAKELPQITVPSAVGNLQKEETYQIPTVAAKGQETPVDFLPPYLEQDK